MKRQYNLKDVAQKAGVSLGTASKVINNIYVKPESRLKVEEAMRELDYTPNAIARSLKSNSTKTIGVMIPDISSPVVGKVLKGIEEVSRRSGYAILIYNTSRSEAEEMEGVQTFLQNKVAGIIYSGNTVSNATAGALKRTGVPIVFIMTDYPDKSFSSVTIDNQKAAYCAVDYLCSCGHEKIIMLAGEKDDPNAGIPRLEGYRKALVSNGIRTDKELVFFGGYDLERGYSDMKRILQSGILFTAVFAASDDLAIGAMKALEEKKINVPNQVSVMGFDGIEMVHYTSPALSTISQPFGQMGRESARILIDRMKEGRGNTRLTLPFQLDKNESVAAVRR